MVIIVLAGAVAEPMAPNIMQNSQERPKRKRIPKVTTTAAVKLSKRVKTMALPPLERSMGSLKKRPTEKAIIAKAMSVTTSRL
jgi:hypothetical protein